MNQNVDALMTDLVDHNDAPELNEDAFKELLHQHLSPETRDDILSDELFAELENAQKAKQLLQSLAPISPPPTLITRIMRRIRRRRRARRYEANTKLSVNFEVFALIALIVFFSLSIIGQSSHNKHVQGELQQLIPNKTAPNSP